MTILPPKGSRIIPVTALLVLAGLILALISPLLPLGGPYGRADARRDIANGHLRIKTFVSDFGWQKQWRDTVKEKYGITLGGGSRGCFISGFDFSYDTAYNAEQRAEITRRFGTDVVSEEMKLAMDARK